MMEQTPPNIVSQVEELYARHDIELHNLFSRMLSVETGSVVLQEDDDRNQHG